MAKKAKNAQKRKSIPWADYSKTDWVPLGGKSRRYALRGKKGVEISREAYDKHYGSLVGQGSFKRKAAKGKGTLKQAMAPARGRSSGRKLSPVEQERRYAEVARSQKERDIETKIARERQKKRPSKKVTLKNWTRRKAIKRMLVPFSQDAIESARQTAAESKIVWSYWVAFGFINNDTGRETFYNIIGARRINMPFTKKDFNDGIRRMLKTGGPSAGGSIDNVIAAEISLKLTESAQRANGISDPK